MKNQKGITLIALAVTIIVLLILAGVTIVMLTGENSILKQANKARDASVEGTLDEAVKIAVGNILTDELTWPWDAVSSSNASAVETKIKEELKNINSTLEISTAISEKYTYLTITATKPEPEQVVYLMTSTGAVTEAKPTEE